MPDWGEVAIRTGMAVLTLVVFTKLLGKRQVTQLSFFEYITGITIGSIAAEISLNVKNDWLLGLTALTVWFVVSLSMEWMMVKSKRLRTWIEGKPTVLVRDGHVMEHNLRKERMTNEELMSRLRIKNVHWIDDVDTALMEASGDVSILLKRDKNPLTPETVRGSPPLTGMPHTVIQDGVAMSEALSLTGHDQSWLDEQLRRRKLMVSEVYMAQVDEHGRFAYDLYHDDDYHVHSPS